MTSCMWSCDPWSANQIVKRYTSQISASSPCLELTSDCQRRPKPYKSVNVLMFSWKDDDLQCWSEISFLKEVFECHYGFNVAWYLVPSRYQHDFVEAVLRDYQMRYMKPNSLLIFYYGGHAGLAHKFMLAANRTQSSPDLDWTPIHKRLSAMSTDILLILDCCDAAGAITSMENSNPKGKLEIIAACSYPGEAFGPGDESLTAFLINELIFRARSKNPFSVASLYRGILEQVVYRNWKVHSGFQGSGRPVPNPIHLVLGEDHVPSISLKTYAHKRETTDMLRESSHQLWNFSPYHQKLIQACGEDDYIFGEAQTIEEELILRSFSKVLNPNQVGRFHFSTNRCCDGLSFLWNHSHSMGCS